MHAPTLKDAVEDARGVIAMYGPASLPDHDCVPAVREALTRLDAAIEEALERSTRGRLRAADQRDIEKRLRELFAQWDACGEKTQALMLDMKILFGRHIGLSARQL
ncbi:MAG TPA: hypothetical protein VFZ36_02170 [Vicinamibacterales bacterium]